MFLGFSQKAQKHFGDRIILFYLSQETKRKHFWRKKFSELIFGQNLSKKRQIAKQKKSKMAKTGTIGFGLAFRKMKL